MEHNSIRSSLFTWLLLASLLIAMVVAWKSLRIYPDGRVAAPATAYTPNTSSSKPEVVGTVAPRMPVSRSGADASLPHSWTRPSSRPRPVEHPEPAEAPAPVQATKPPPLSFRYVGRLSDGSQQFVFLTAGGGISILREGDMIDATHRIERIDDAGVTIVYLPGSLRQRLSYDSEFSESRTPSAQAPALPALAWDGPTQAMAGSEFSLALSLPGIAVGQADMTLQFDPWALELIDSTAQAVREKGRVTLRFDAGGDGAFLAELRFRVIAVGSVSTSITVEQMTLHDASGIEIRSISTTPHVVFIKL